MKKNICFYTGSRSEYGIFSTLIKKFKEKKKFNINVALSGTHFSKKYGNSFTEVKRDKIQFDKLKINLTSEKYLSIQKQMSVLMIKFSKYLVKKKINFLFVLGDRFDLVPVVYAAVMNRIPVCHLHGGEITSGIIDDYIRHSVTKLSNFHFVSNIKYKKRLTQMGENPKNVFLVGSTSIDKIKNMQFYNKSELSNKFKIKLGNKIILITFQPLSLKKKNSKKEILSLLRVIKEFKSYDVIFTFPNFDLGSEFIIKQIKKVKKQNKNIFYFKTLGQKNYLSFAKISKVVVGNSSSGIIEIPYLGIPVVNVGERQRGRVKHSSIINCNTNTKEIKKSILFAIKNHEKIKKKSIRNKIYGNGLTSQKIYKIFCDYILKQKSIEKKFFDIKN